MKKYDKVIVWRITQHCNMNCLFCSYSNEIDRKRDTSEFSSVIRFIDFLKKYKEKSGKEILVSWIGGEPFLYDKIMNLSAMLFEYGIDVSTTTNGILLRDSKLREGVLKHFSEIVFSLDGFEKCNDRIRNHSGHYEISTKAIAQLCREKTNTGSNTIIKVNTILLNENIGQFEEFCLML